MSQTDEGPNIKARATSLVGQVFTAQLDILQSFLPLRAWLVGHDDGDRFSVVATIGLFSHCHGPHLTQLTRGQWMDDPDYPDVFYRPISITEQNFFDNAKVISHGSGDLSGSVLVRIELDSPDSAIAAYVVGLVPQWPWPALIHNTDRAQLCLRAMGLIAALYTELSAASERVTEMQRDAFIDPLTAVLNRAGWNHRLKQVHSLSQTTGTDVAIIMLDLDFLKEVNDSQGHSAGDDLLRLTAQTISSVLRGGDWVARLGGDEFGVVVKNATSCSADQLLGRLTDAFGKIKVRISMGAALSSEVGGKLQKAVELADARMYQDKRAKPALEALPIDWMVGVAGVAAGGLLNTLDS